MGKKRTVRQILIDALQELEGAKGAEEVREVAYETAGDLLDWHNGQVEPETRAEKMLRVSALLHAVVDEMDGMGSDVPALAVADLSERYGRHIGADQILAAVGCMLALEAEKKACAA